jgi:hypothetical protein
MAPASVRGLHGGPRQPGCVAIHDKDADAVLVAGRARYDQQAVRGHAVEHVAFFAVQYVTVACGTRLK